MRELEPVVGMHLRAVGPYWAGRGVGFPRAVIVEVTDGLVVLDSTEKGQSQRWSRGNFWTMWEEVPNPVSLEDAVLWFSSTLGPEDREYLLLDKGDFASIQVKIQALRWIRNELGLWEHSRLYVHMWKLGYTHPDDMSRRILEEFIRSGGRGMPETRFDRPDPV